MKTEKYTKNLNSLVLGTYVYDLETGDLTDSAGQIVHMRRQSAEVLSVLAQHAGEVVSRDRLVESVWKDVATTDDSLVQCIADIRRTLGREAIETFPKKGYLLRPGPTWPAYRLANARTTHIWLILAAAIAVAATALFLTSHLRATSKNPAVVPPEISQDRTLAVLPFVNLSDDLELRYFSDGLSEDLTTELSRVPKLTVISHASSLDFRDAESGFAQIARNLGVRYLVRGTVRHDRDRVRINVALVDPYGGFNLWTDRFDRFRSNPFDVQDEVTRRIVEALSLTLASAETAPRRIEPDAYYMLLRGLHPLRQQTAASNMEAREYFRRAVALDPEYARAYAYIAITYGRETLLSDPGKVTPVAIERGLEAAITAIQLDPDIPHAFFALGVLNLALAEFDNALAATRHAVRLDTNFSDGYALLAEIGVRGGDLDEALAAIRRAKLLHPHHPFTYHWIEGHILFQQERYEEAQPLLEEAVALNSQFLLGLITLAASYGMEGEADSAGATLKKALAIKPELGLDAAIAALPYRYKDRSRKLALGLRLAGLVE